MYIEIMELVLLTVPKVRLIRALTDSNHISVTGCKNAPTVGKKAPPVLEGGGKLQLQLPNFVLFFTLQTLVLEG